MKRITISSKRTGIVDRVNLYHKIVNVKNQRKYSKENIWSF